MEKYDYEKYGFIRVEGSVYRILELDDELLVIDCVKRNMPIVIPCGEYEVLENYILPTVVPMEELSPEDRKTALNRYTVIAPVLSVLTDRNKRNMMIDSCACQFEVSKQTVRKYLCDYLVFQDVAVLAPKKNSESKELTEDQKNMRWALNKFFYTTNKNFLSTAYTMLLKEKYCDGNGNLLEKHPTFNQFRYFYRKTRNTENYLISRNGLKDYQRNDRPLVNGTVQDFAQNIGTAMLDGTICDIYLVDDKGQLVGRPILVAAVDANTSLCLGYSLLWEGGTYSLVQLMKSIITDKVELCKSRGIHIEKSQWNVDSLPGIMVTDRGSEYLGQNFEQIAELGVTLITLPSYRADMKGPVEKLFSLIQDTFKEGLKNKGVIMPDWQQRGSHDYRKDACLTLKDFERVILKCIVYYNSQRIVESYPYTQQMFKDRVRPYASEIWNFKLNEPGTNLIRVSTDELAKTLLPRTMGRFTRFGLKVNKLRYYADGYKEEFLTGGEVVVAYNPDDCSRVWLREDDGRYIEFELIESRFLDMPLEEVKDIQRQQKELIQNEAEENLRARIELMEFIESASSKKNGDVNLKSVRKTRTTERNRNHKNLGDDINV